MNRLTKAAVGVAASLLLGSGCGSDTPPPTKINSSADAGPNARLKFKEEYKQMIGKDGQLLWKPSSTTKRPPGIPKS